MQKFVAFEEKIANLKEIHEFDKFSLIFKFLNIKIKKMPANFRIIYKLMQIHANS